MVASLLILVAAQAADPTPATLLTTARDKLSVSDAAQADPSARYRVDAEPVRDDAKARALGTTGGQCQVVGARMCTRSPRTWLKTPLGR